MVIVSQGRWTAGNSYVYNDNTIVPPTATTISSPATAFLSGATFSGYVKINGASYFIGQHQSLSQLNAAIVSSGYQASITPGSVVDYLTLTAQTVGPGATPPTFDFSPLSASSISNALILFQTPPGGQMNRGTPQSLTLSDGAGHNFTSTSTVTNGGGSCTYTFSNGLVAKSSDPLGPVQAVVTAVAGSSTLL